MRVKANSSLNKYVYAFLFSRINSSLIARCFGHADLLFAANDGLYTADQLALSTWVGIKVEQLILERTGQLIVT